MGSVKAIAVKASEPALLEQSRKVKHALGQARLRALSLYKRGQAGSYEQLGKAIGYERHAVGQWFKLVASQTTGPGKLLHLLQADSPLAAKRTWYSLEL